MMHPELIAVDDAENQSKGVRHPADYKPRSEFWGIYATAWERIKGPWELEMTPREEEALEQLKAL